MYVLRHSKNAQPAQLVPFARASLCTVRIQAAFRAFAFNKRFGRILASVLAIQCAIRGKASRRVLKDLKADAKSFAKVAARTR